MHFEYNPHKFDRPAPKEPILPLKPLRMAKRWKVAPRHHMGKHYTGLNMALESHFMSIRKEVRKLYAQQNEYFYDRDYRNDNADPCSMHTIACSTLYMNLDCSYSYEYELQYHIEDSPFRDAIAALIRTAGKPKVMEPSMAAYFAHMRSYYSDDPRYFSYLKAEDEQ